MAAPKMQLSTRTTEATTIAKRARKLRRGELSIKRNREKLSQNAIVCPA